MSESSSPDKSPVRNSWIARATALLLACLAVLAAVVAADRVLQLGVFRSALALQLEAAAKAVLPTPADEAGREFTLTTDNGGIAIPVPATLSYDRVETIRLMLELDAMRSECVRSIARLKTLDYLGAESQRQAVDAERIEALWRAAQDRLGAFLTLEPHRASVVLASLGWPRVGDGTKTPSARDLDPPFPARPAVLGEMPREAWRALMRDAQVRRPWPELRALLAQRHNLTDAQLAAVQAYVCRSHVERAFDSPRANREARRSLEQHAALTPVQVRTVLAMAGARELLAAGTFAFPALIDILERRPELGTPLLHECVRRTAVREQALRAAAQLEGPDSASAENTLVALGPFGAEAVSVALARQLLSNAAPWERLRTTISASWPAAASALDALGQDPELWRRWYRQARKVL